MSRVASPGHAPVVIKDWSIYAHPLLLDQIEALLSQVLALKAADPEHYKHKNCTKRLAAILKLITDNVPADPMGKQFRQGDSLGEDRTHWFRAKFFSNTDCFSGPTTPKRLSSLPG